MSERVLPWSESCFVCGDANPQGLHARFSAEGARVKLEITVDPKFEGYPGHTHGGVITALLDETAGWACCVATHKMYFTAEIKVRFRAAVPAGEPIVVTAEYLGAKERFALARAEITDAGGRVLATAEGVFAPVPAEVQEYVMPRLKMPGRAARAEDF